MELNADFSKRAIVHSQKEPWVKSPIPGVERRMLDRIGDEIARATSIVKYAPGSSFSAHTHTGGEEFIVLEGVFQDEHGDYPAGTYVRNPPTTSHTPGSDEGCVIFVKLWQFDMTDREQFRKDMNTERLAGSAEVGTAVLHKDERETVSFHMLKASAELQFNELGGTEVLILEGTAQMEGETLTPGSWMRLPDADLPLIRSGPEGAKIWSKTGHLPFAKAPEN